jgi:hypothetical protein
MQVLSERQKKIAEGLEAAERASRDLELTQKNVAEKLREAKKQSQAIIEKKAIDCPIIVALIFTPTPLASVNVRVGESLATLRLLRSLHTHTLINFGLSHNVMSLRNCVKRRNNLRPLLSRPTIGPLSLLRSRKSRLVSKATG